MAVPRLPNKKLLGKQNKDGYKCESVICEFENNDVRERWEKQTQKVLDHSLWTRHFGLKYYGYTLNSLLRRKPHHWGFKDPRALLFVPLWKLLYPKAIVVLMLRNPLGVVLSLYDRQKRKQLKFNRLGKGRRYLTLTLERCFDIWKFYSMATMKFARQFAPDTYVIRYDNLSEDRELQRFLTRVGLLSEMKLLNSAICYNRRQYPTPEGWNEFVEKISADPIISELGFAKPIAKKLLH